MQGKGRNRSIISPLRKNREAEVRKNKFDMAEYDQQFIDRMMNMSDEEILAYLHSLPEAERGGMEEAILRVMSQEMLKSQLQWLRGWIGY